MSSYEAIYGRGCRTPLNWLEWESDVSIDQDLYKMLKKVDQTC
jgi:hypothetical protein